MTLARTPWLALALLVSSTAFAQVRTPSLIIPRPLPPTAPSAQPVRIQLSGAYGQFQTMTLFGEAGDVTSPWTIPAGKTLVVTDVSLQVFLTQRAVGTQGGSLYQYFTTGASLGILGFDLSNRQNGVFTQSYASGWAFTAANPPYFSVILDPGNVVGLQAAQIWMSGYLRDSQ